LLESSGAGQGPIVSLVAGGRAPARRTPFVVLMVGVLGVGLIALLLLNSVLAANSFAQRRLQKQNSDLSLREQELAREIAALEAPGALESAASRLGLVPSGQRGFLIIDKDGHAHITGTAVPATAPPPPPTPTPTPTAAAPGNQPLPGQQPVPPNTSSTASQPQLTTTPGQHR
jgi:cell division protein FtsB